MDTIRDIDDDSDESKSFVTVTNNYGVPLGNVTVGVLVSATKTDLVKNVGNLDQGAVSERIEITHEETDNVLIFFDYNGKSYMIMQPYPFAEGGTTNLTITEIINVTEILKSSDLYPK